MTAEKIRENKLRRMATRQGYALTKSRRRDPRAYDYGGYMIVDPNTNSVVAGGSPLAFCLDIDQVEAWLTDDEEEAASMADMRQRDGHTLEEIREIVGA